MAEKPRCAWQMPTPHLSSYSETQGRLARQGAALRVGVPWGIGPRQGGALRSWGSKATQAWAYERPGLASQRVWAGRPTLLRPGGSGDLLLANPDGLRVCSGSDHPEWEIYGVYVLCQ